MTLTSRLVVGHFPEDGMCGVVPGGPADFAARMGAGATQKQSFDSRAVTGPVSQHLSRDMMQMMDVAVG